LFPEIVARDQHVRTDLAPGREAAIAGQQNPPLFQRPLDQLSRLALANVGGVVAQDAKPASK